MEEGYFTGNLGQVSYQGMCRIKLWKWVSLSTGEPGGGSVSWELQEIVEGGLRKWSISLCESSVGGTWRGASLLGIQKDM